jgi:hypothetical protein
MQARTRGGVFGPGGYGGGIFDGSDMGFGGLGGLGQPEQAAAGIRGLGAASGLGQACYTPSICTQVLNKYPGDVSSSLRKDIEGYCDQGLWESTPEAEARRAATDSACWNVWNLNEAAAPVVTTEPGVDMPSEYQAFVEEQAPSVGPAYTAPTTQYVQYPWNSFSAGTQSLQISANVELRLRNQPTIAEDGILGPTTCGALKYLYDEGVQGQIVPPTCQSFSYTATPVTAPTVPSGYTPEQIAYLCALTKNEEGLTSVCAKPECRALYATECAAPSETTPVPVGPAPAPPTPAPPAPAPPTPAPPAPMKAGMSPATMGIIGVLGVGAVVGIFAATRKKKS